MLRDSTFNADFRKSHIGTSVRESQMLSKSSNEVVSNLMDMRQCKENIKYNYLLNIFIVFYSKKNYRISKIIKTMPF